MADDCIPLPIGFGLLSKLLLTPDPNPPPALYPPSPFPSLPSLYGSSP